MRKPEIMAPAGDWICLRAALDAGCDSVYFGIESLNMRAGAPNFTREDLPKIMDLCREAGVKGYLTLNTIVYEEELAQVGEVIGSAVDAGVDAVICSDFSVLNQASEAGLPAIISTQMSISNSESMVFLYRSLGVTRFVLARECTLEDVARIKAGLRAHLGDDAAEIELEVFIHGAMCVSVSGRCFLSHDKYGKSANRGECLQPCRREFVIGNEEGDMSYVAGGDYLLSPKDLCVMPFIEQLIDAGISRFKIEGRNRNAEYVSTVTTAYRRAVDYYCDCKGNDGFEAELERIKSDSIEEMKKVYNRGFSSGFFMGKPSDAWAEVSGSAAIRKKAYSGIVTNYYAKPGVAEILIHDNGFGIDDELMFQGQTTGVVVQKVQSIELEHGKIDKADKGMLVAVKTDSIVHKKDKVFIMVDQDQMPRSRYDKEGE